MVVPLSGPCPGHNEQLESQELLPDVGHKLVGGHAPGTLEAPALGGQTSGILVFGSPSESSRLHIVIVPASKGCRTLIRITSSESGVKVAVVVAVVGTGGGRGRGSLKGGRESGGSDLW